MRSKFVQIIQRIQEAKIFSSEEKIFIRRNKFIRRKTTAVIDLIDV
jgi:hypothetical protein